MKTFTTFHRELDEGIRDALKSLVPGAGSQPRTAKDKISQHTIDGHSDNAEALRSLHTKEMNRHTYEASNSKDAGKKHSHRTLAAHHGEAAGHAQEVSDHIDNTGDPVRRFANNIGRSAEDGDAKLGFRSHGEMDNRKAKIDKHISKYQTHRAEVDKHEMIHAEKYGE